MVSSATSGQVTRLFLLVILRQEEQRPEAARDRIIKIPARDEFEARALAREGLIELGRTSPPAYHLTARLTQAGREQVDDLARRRGESCN